VAGDPGDPLTSDSEAPQSSHCRRVTPAAPPAPARPAGGGRTRVVDRFALLDAAGPVTPNPILTTATLDLTWAVTGLIALALAEAFAVGRRLTDLFTVIPAPRP
jgi:hypothetical protein